MKSIFVFVYGSLKSGHYNHSLLSNSVFVSNHITEPKFTLVDLGAFPAVLSHGATSIQGELYKVTEKTLAELDKLEGYPKYYDRMKILTDVGNAWMYTLVKGSKDYPVIESGIWNPDEF